MTNLSPTKNPNKHNSHLSTNQVTVLQQKTSLNLYRTNPSQHVLVFFWSTHLNNINISQIGSWNPKAFGVNIPQKKFELPPT